MNYLTKTFWKLILELFIVLCVCFSSLAWADPAISTVEGSVYNGNTITIQGTDFGNDGPNIVIFDDFEGGTNGGDILVRENSVAPVGRWTEKGDEARTNPGTMHYSNTYSNSGTLSYVGLTGDTYSGGKAYLRTTFSPASNYVFQSYWVFLPAEDNWPGDGSAQGGYNWKQTWFFHDLVNANDLDNYCGGGSGSDTRKAIIATGNHSGVDGNNQGTVGNITKGHWCRVSVYLYGNTSHDRGRCVAYNIGRKGIDTMTKTVDVTKSTQDYDNQPYQIWEIGAYAWKNIGSVSHLTFDDVYCASGPNCRARIEIGDASTYTDCTNMAIITPTSWQNNQITAVVRSGSFRNGDAAYLFVVKGDGTISDGYPIVIGGDNPPANNPPTEDTIAPHTTAHSPAKSSTNVPVNESISVHIQDSGDGVDLSSIVMTVNGQTVTPTISGTQADYTLIYSPPENWSYGEEVAVTLSAQDLHTPANVMPQESYSFAIVSDSSNAYTAVFGDGTGSNYPGTCQDTFVNLSNTNNSDNTETLNTYTWPEDAAASRSVIKWDLSVIPQDAIIQEATLSLYMYGYEGTGGVDNYEIPVHKIINHNPNISTCTWNTYDGSNTWTGGTNGGEQDMAPAESSTIVSKTAGYNNWTITQMVQEWVNNPSSNYGLILDADISAATNSNRFFRPTEYSDPNQRPKLIIQYYLGNTNEKPSPPNNLRVIDTQ